MYNIQVMDSYVDVKIKEAIYDMKEVLQNVEEQFAKVVQEKARMESILSEKVQLIRVRLCMCYGAQLHKHFCINLYSLSILTQCYEQQANELWSFIWVAK